jgi:hypothetical protein
VRANTCATLVLPPGESMGKSLSAVPRVTVHLAYLALMRALGVRIVSLGRGFSSRSLVNRLHELGISELAHCYSLRDAATISAARALGIRKAVWFPDLSWLTSTPQPQDVLFTYRSSVVLCFRADMDHVAADERLAASILEKLGGLLEEATALGLQDFVLVQHDRHDGPLTTQVEARYGERYHLRREPGLLSLADVPRIYGNAALVLSNRLHSLLLGLQWGAVGMALVRVSEERKIRNQLLDIELGDIIVDLDAPRLDRGLIQHTLARHASVGEAVAAYRQKAVITAHATLTNLFRS